MNKKELEQILYDIQMALACGMGEENQILECPSYPSGNLILKHANGKHYRIDLVEVDENYR